MNKAVRQQIIAGALKAAFDPLFDKLVADEEAIAAQMVREQHPRFLELIAQEEAKKYVSCHGALGIFVSTGPARRPNYLVTSEFLHDHIRVYARGIYPTCMSKVQMVNSYKYDTLWNQYFAARTELAKLVYSYKTLAKLAEDYPEVAKYGPPAQVPASLPMVVNYESLRDVGILK